MEEAGAGGGVGGGEYVRARGRAGRREICLINFLVVKRFIQYIQAERSKPIHIARRISRAPSAPRHASRSGDVTVRGM
jgi:hypothetical protein